MYKSERFWNILSYRYDKMAQRVEDTRIKTIDNISRYLTPDDIVLDYGCGTGLYSNEIAANVSKVYGIDISSKMINHAKKKAKDQSIENVEYMQATIFDGTFKERSLDVILVLNVLHLVEDPQKVTKKIYALLKQGGYMISSTECMEENKSFISGAISFFGKIGIIPKLQFFRTSELEELITNSKFHIIETEDFYDFKQPNHFIVAQK